MAVWSYLEITSVVEEVVAERLLDDPGLLLHLGLELPGSPPGVTGEHA